MSKKILISIAPLVAVVAFAVMPAMASAATREYGACEVGTPETHPPCPTGEKNFKAFAAGEKVKVTDKKAAASGAFILENEAKTADIECGTFSSTGTVENVAGVGKSTESLTYGECKGSGELAACSINPKTKKHEITGEVTNEVLASGAEVEIKIKSGFNVKCLVGTEEKELGGVTGSTVGDQAAGSAVLIFTQAKGLTFLGLGSTITGEAETNVKSTGRPVVIN